MKFLPVFILSVALLALGLPLAAQTTDDSDADAPPPGSTVITSDELHSDQNTHISVFTGNVVVIGTNFKMTCQEMTVYFTKDNKVDHIVSTGDVVITQPNRVTHCGHAEYFHDEDKFILTDQPMILDGKNQVMGPKIIIYRTTQKMEIPPGGGRTHVILGPDSMKSATPSPAPADNK